MLTEIIAYKVYSIFRDAEIENTKEGNWRYAERVVEYFNNKDEDKAINQDHEEFLEVDLNSIENLGITHLTCNKKKSYLTLEEWFQKYPKLLENKK